MKPGYLNQRATSKIEITRFDSNRWLYQDHFVVKRLRNKQRSPEQHVTCIINTRSRWNELKWYKGKPKPLFDTPFDLLTWDIENTLYMLYYLVLCFLYSPYSMSIISLQFNTNCSRNLLTKIVSWNLSLYTLK